jgi:hypothetical protein
MHDPAIPAPVFRLMHRAVSAAKKTFGILAMCRKNRDADTAGDTGAYFLVSAKGCLSACNILLATTSTTNALSRLLSAIVNSSPPSLAEIPDSQMQAVSLRLTSSNNSSPAL